MLSVKHVKLGLIWSYPKLSVKIIPSQIDSQRTHTQDDISQNISRTHIMENGLAYKTPA